MTGVDGVRLRLRKKNSTAPAITYPEALDSALCSGWIDGQAMRLTGQKDAPVPDDLHDALRANSAPAEFFAILSAQNRFVIPF